MLEDGVIVTLVLALNGHKSDADVCLGASGTLANMAITRTYAVSPTVHHTSPLCACPAQLPRRRRCWSSTCPTS